MNFIRNRNFRAGPQTSLEGFICPQNSDKQQKIKVFGRSVGGHYLDPSDEKPKNERAPMVPIYFDQDGHTFTFNSSLVGETVEVVIDDEVLYTTVVGEDGIVVVPEFISGEVELRLYRGSLVYQVTVEL